MDYNATQGAVKRKLEGISAGIVSAFDNGQDSLGDMQVILTFTEQAVLEARRIIGRCDEQK